MNHEEVEKLAIRVVRAILEGSDPLDLEFETLEEASAIMNRVINILKGSPFRVVASGNCYGVYGTNGKPN